MSGLRPVGFQTEPKARPVELPPTTSAPVSKKSVVIDASVGVKWYVPEIHSAEARRFLDVGFERHIPSHFYVEFANTVWKKVLQRKELTVDEGRELRAKVERVPTQVHSTTRLLPVAFEIALATQRTVYDCVYVALADHLKCKAVTADEKLYNSLRSGPFSGCIHWIADPI